MVENPILHKEELKKKLGYKCVYCGCTNKMILTIDHKIPLARGGSDDDKNKHICCYICNQLKDRLTHAEFKKYLNTLYSLKDLAKVQLVLQPPKLIFKPYHFPSFNPIKEVQNE